MGGPTLPVADRHPDPTCVTLTASILEIPDTITNPTPTESKMTAALGPLPLGGTDAGKRWCRKALHPADIAVASAPVPGCSKVPTVSSNFTQVLEIEPPALSDPDDHITNWDVEIYFREDPVVPISAVVHSHGEFGSDSSPFPWLNTTVTDFNPTPSAGVFAIPTASQVNRAYATFRSGKNFYRITHAGLTIQHVCSATTNQGTVISAQYAMRPVTKILAGYPITQHINTATLFGVADEDRSTAHYPAQLPVSGQPKFTYFVCNQFRHYPERPMPEATLLQATHGYTGVAKDGLYIPLKLSHPQKMINVDQRYIWGDATESSATVYAWEQRGGTIGQQSGWPFYYKHEVDTGTGAPILITGNKECGTTVSHTVIKGLDPHASLRLFLRVGIEFVPETSSEYAAFARAVPPPDTVALKVYQEIAACLKDAYTRDYNDSSRLLKVIGDAARKVLPVINKGLNAFATAVPGPYGAVARGAKKLVDAFLAPPARPARKKKKRGARRVRVPAPPKKPAPPPPRQA